LLNRWENLDKENTRSRKEQSFYVPVDEIRKNDYNLTFNKYKEVIRKKEVFDNPKDVFERIEKLETQIIAMQKEYRTKYLNANE
jgi:type I restriction enzyme M protein